MNSQKLQYLLSQEEGPKLDFKASLSLKTASGKKELAKDIIAIANSQGGRGYLVIGVEDKTKRIVGVTPGEYDEERIQQVLTLRCDPPINIRVEYLDVEDKHVCVITVFRSFKKPHQMLQTGAFYLRRGSTTDVARRNEIASMLQRGGLINNEQMPVLSMGLDVYDKDLVHKYLTRLNLGDQTDNYGLLANLGYIHYDRDTDSFCPTIGGLLLFCEKPQDYFPHLGIRIIDMLDVSKQTVHINGNLFKMMDDASKYLRALDVNYPIEAIEEAIFNAVLHRDYFDNSRDILVYLSHKKVVVSSPGAIFGREKVNNIIHQFDSRRRNNWLYHQMLTLDEKRRFIKMGTGLQFIKQELKPYGRVQILNLRKIDLFKVVMPGIEGLSKSEVDNEQE